MKKGKQPPSALEIAVEQLDHAIKNPAHVWHPIALDRAKAVVREFRTLRADPDAQLAFLDVKAIAKHTVATMFPLKNVKVTVIERPKQEPTRVTVKAG
jgi:hypothetical protein